MLKTCLKSVSFFILFLSLGSIGYFTTGCGLEGVTDEIADDNLSPTDDNSLDGESDGSTSGDTESNDDSSSDSSTSSSSSGGSSDNSTTGDSSDSSSGTTSSSSGGNTIAEGPPGESVPIAAATKQIESVASDETLTYNQDESLNTPSIGDEGAVDTTVTYSDGTTETMTDADGDGYVDDYYVAASEASLEETADRGSPFVDRGSWFASVIPMVLYNVIPADSKRGSIFIRSAYASESTDYCTQDGVTIAPIATDGSFELYYPSTTMPSTLYLYVTDCTTLSSGITETPNDHLLWFKQNTLDIASTGTGSDSQQYFHALTEDTGVSVVERSGTFAVQEDYELNYRNFTTTDATLFAYASGYEGLLEATTGISLFTSAFDSANRDWLTMDSGVNSTATFTDAYTSIKITTKGDIWWGRKPSAEYWNYTDYEYVYSIGFDENNASHVNNPDYVMRIFDKTTMGDYGQTITFDLDSNKVALAIFTDSSGNYRMSMGYYESDLLWDFVVTGGTTAFDPSTNNFKDLVIFNEQSGYTSSASEYGSYLLLDSQSKVVWVKNYFGNYMSDSADTFSETLSDSVAVGNGATNIAISDNTAFVLNGEDATITAFRIKNDRGRVLTAVQMTSTIQTISLSDYLNGKSVSLNAAKVIYQSTASGNYLMVSTPGIKGAMVLEAPTVEAPTPTTVPVNRTRTRSNFFDLDLLRR